MDGPESEGIGRRETGQGAPDPVRVRILERVRAAASGRTPVPHPGPWPGPGGEVPDGGGVPTRGATPGASPPPGEPDASGPLARFCASFEAAGGETLRFGSLEEARTWVDGFAREVEGAYVSPWVPGALRPPVPPMAPEDAPLGVSVARAAAADTGSLLLDAREGRRGQLLPPTHLIWVAEDAVAPSLAEALERVKDDLPSALGLHSGPSKSADIGGVLVQGVHGPGRVIAALVPGGAARGPGTAASARREDEPSDGESRE